jgi:hypothetical protein
MTKSANVNFHAVGNKEFSGGIVKCVDTNEPTEANSDAEHAGLFLDKAKQYELEARSAAVGSDEYTESDMFDDDFEDDNVSDPDYSPRSSVSSDEDGDTL